MVIIRTNYDGQESPMQNKNKFRGDRPAGSGERDFLKFFFYHI